MPSERVQRQIDRLLDEAEQASAIRDWATVAERCRHVLTFDPENDDARSLLAAAERGLADPLPLDRRGPHQEAEGQGEGQPEQQAGRMGTPAAPPGPLPNPPLPGEGPDPVTSAGSAGASPAVVPASFANGRYQVKRFLGEGGKKRVFLAHDILLDRDVAFALIKTEGLDAVARERVAREAQAMGRLGSHPRIVTVFDLGEEPDLSPGLSPTRGEESKGQPYMVTELMGGGDVEGLIEKAPEHRLPLEQALRIATQVCEGLEFAHGKGIVHRDLKPGNVWLTEAVGGRPSLSLAGEGQGEGETRAAASSRTPVGLDAKIGDFGLAVAIDRTRLTQAGMMVGTVGYMPPEQATGGEVTERSDLYSLGAMLYELVTGRPPFIGDEAVAIIGQHLNTPPVAPTWHRPDCPTGLEALILRLLEKDPGRRPASAAEVRVALESVREAGAMNRAPTPGRVGSLSLAGEGEGEGETRANGSAPEPSAQNPLYRRAFVGRESELRSLHAAFDAALSGKGALAMVVGEPGIGKTSVCEQLATYATLRGGKTLVGHCYEEGSLSLPYLPFVEAMRSYVLAREPDGLKSDLGTGAEDIARIVSEVRDRIAGVQPVGARFIAPAHAPVGDPEEQRWRLLQAVTSFLRNASAVQPLVIILEDLHDADRGTLDLLVHLSRNLDGARLLIAGTYRDVEVDRGHPLSSALAELRRGQNFLRVPLRGLTAEEVQRMMAAVAQREIPWPFAELVHRQTEGNPLFVQEMLRYLVEEGLVAEQGGALRRVGDDTLAGRIPEGLRDVIGKRLSRLADKTNQVLSIASVVGREFRLDVLQQVANLPSEDVEQALEEAGSVAVVEQRQGVGGQLSFRFTHAFFRQTLYEELFAARRIRLHQQVARALEAVYGRRVDEHAAELAEHYSNSSDPGDLGKAVEYGEIAAKRSMAVFAYGEAARHLEQALKAQDVLDPDDKLKRCDLLLALGEAILPSEDPGRVVDSAAEEGFALADALGDSGRASRVAVLALEGLARRSANPVMFRSPEFGAWVQRADRHAQARSRERIYADVYLGMHSLWTVSPAAAHPYLRRAADAALAGGDDEACFMAAGWAFRNLLAVQDFERVRALTDELRRRPRNRARPVDAGSCLFHIGRFLIERGERAVAEECWRELSDLAETTRDATLRVLSAQTGVPLALLEGRLADALSLEETAGVLSQELLTQPRTGTTRNAVAALIHLGRAEEALSAYAEPSSRPEWAGRARCLAHLGRHAELRAIRERFGDLTSDSDETSRVILVELLEAAILGRDTETAEIVSRRFAAVPGYTYDFATALCISRLLGSAAALMGDAATAWRYFEQAIEVSARVGSRPELALTRP